MRAVIVSDRTFARAAMAALTLGVHLLALWLLLRHAPIRIAIPERILYLPITQPAPRTVPKPVAAPSKPSKQPVPAAQPSSTAPVAMPAPAQSQSLQGLHGLLFGCAPGNILNAEDRRRCQTVTGVPEQIRPAKS